MKFLCIFLLLLLPIYANAEEGVHGFDSRFAFTVEDFKCLFEEENYQFYISRIYRSLGEIDDDGIQNIINARKAGMEFVDGYMIPCLKEDCPTAKRQVELVVNTTWEKGAQIGILWLSIQELSCNTILKWPLTQNCNESWKNWPWSANLTFNQAFIIEMVKQAEAMGIRVGIYASKNHWTDIVGVDWNGVSDKPLWFARFHNTHDFTEYDPFGGWKAPSMRNFEQNYESPCNVTINRSWYPESGMCGNGFC